MVHVDVVHHGLLHSVQHLIICMRLLKLVQDIIECELIIFQMSVLGPQCSSCGVQGREFDGAKQFANCPLTFVESGIIWVNRFRSIPIRFRFKFDVRDPVKWHRFSGFRVVDCITMKGSKFQAMRIQDTYVTLVCNDEPIDSNNTKGLLKAVCQ